MKKTLVGEITHSEMCEIRILNGHVCGLEELLPLLQKGSDEFINASNDLELSKSKYKDWWNQMSKKYQWRGSENGRWSADFNDCKIYLIEQ